MSLQRIEMRLDDKSNCLDGVSASVSHDSQYGQSLVKDGVSASVSHDSHLSNSNMHTKTNAF